MIDKPKSRGEFVIVLRPPADADAVRLLRAALKVLLRRFGLRCISVTKRRL